MKFTDGHWLTREGYTIHSAKTVYDITITEQQVTVYLPCKPIRHRGDTLDGPMLTLEISSPASDVLRLHCRHFDDGLVRNPAFTVNDRHHPMTTQQDGDTVSIHSGQLQLVMQTTHPFAMAFYDNGRRVTGGDDKALAWITHQQQTYMRAQLDIGVGEQLYGLGERFTPFVKNGQVVDCWNQDGGTSTEQSYKNVPFYLSSNGYGVFVNHPEAVSFELGSEVVAKNQFSVAGESLDFYLINGPHPKTVLERYTDLTGRPPLPPAWTFGLWLTTSFTTDYNEQTVQHFVDGMLDRDIPLSVFHFDCFWMKGMQWCDFQWDTDSFPDPQGMLARLHDKGLKVCVWINPYIAQKSPLYREAVEHGYLLKRADGGVWQWDLWQAGMGIVDFTNPAATDWYCRKLEPLLDMGVDCFKTDFGERIPTDVVYHNGADPLRMHNYYAQLYNKTVFRLLQRHRGEHDAAVFARSATVGGQCFPIHWGGDCYATYESMAESLRGGLSLTASGFGYWSHDIGGFEHTASPDLFKRWLAFGLLSSHSRLHGSSSYRVPWLFDEEAVQVTRHFTQLKHRLMPYIYQCSVTNRDTGIPVMRAMHIEFPDDPTCLTLDRQYMLGNDLLVAPVFSDDGDVQFYLPAGKWTHLLDGEMLTGPGWYRRRYDYMSLGLFARPGSLIAFGHQSGSVVYDYDEQPHLHLYSLADGEIAMTIVPDKQGRESGCIRIERQGEHLKLQSSLVSHYSLTILDHQVSMEEVEITAKTTTLTLL
ncbi:alpha-xylosidase [Gynuella sp.]|uniref:alpha-xylosidase n=1 Tax=Gynuella sp. TaxID=2969146 RepID=UPI003D0E2B30